MSRPIALTNPVRLGESPLWDSSRRCLIWVDLGTDAVHEFDETTATDMYVHFDVPVGAVVHRASGGLLFAAGMGFASCMWPDPTLNWIASVDRGIRMNDGACDPAGRFVAGTLLPNDSAGAALYQLEHGRVTMILPNVSISNGVDWSPDGRTMYYVDTPLERIDAFDYDVVTGSIGNRRMLIDLCATPGRPDGLTVDAEGGIWVAMARGGAAVRRFLPDGRADHVVEMPAPNITSIAFGGEGLHDLYITTSRLGLGADDLARWPNAGALFRVSDAGVAGREPYRYAG